MSFSPGTVVYAKLKGYPWWPARVEVESSLPSHVRSKKPKTPKPTFGVRFFGSKDYGWFGSNDLKPFDKKDAEVTLQKMKNKKHDKLLERSIREALDPSAFDEPINEEGDDDVVSDYSGDLENESKKSSESNENEEDEGEYAKKSKSRNKGNKKYKKATDHRRTSGGKLKKKSRSYSSDDEDDLNHGGKVVKKRRASEGAAALDKISKHKQRKIDYYTDDDEEKMDFDDEKSELKKERRQNVKKDRASRSEGSKSPVKSDNESPEGDVDDKDENKYNKEDDEIKSSRMESESHHRSSKSRQTKTPGDRLLHLRHKLQRMTLKDDVESLDMEKIDEVFTEVENFPITIPLLKESKIGKLMRKIVAEKNIDPDPKKIIERSNELIRKWKCLLEVPTHEGSDEETSPKTVTQIEGDSPHRDETIHNIHNEESNQPLPDEQEIDIKKDDENFDNYNVKEEKERLLSAMDIDEINDVQPETGEEKIVEDKDNVVTNGSSATNNQEVNSQDFNNKTPEL